MFQQFFKDFICFQVTEVGLKSLAKYSPYIEAVDLSECYHTTDSCIETMTKDITRLATLKLNGCVQLTDAILEHIRANCKYLKVTYLKFYPDFLLNS